MVCYVRHFDDDKKIMSFNATDNRLLKKYNKIWEKVGILMNRKFDSDPVYCHKYMSSVKWTVLAHSDPRPNKNNFLNQS